MPGYYSGALKPLDLEFIYEFVLSRIGYSRLFFAAEACSSVVWDMFSPLM